jgi:hypothetical protein
MPRPGPWISPAGAALVGGGLTTPLLAEVALTFPPPFAADLQALPMLVTTTPANRRIKDQPSPADLAAMAGASGCTPDLPHSHHEPRGDIAFLGPGYLPLRIPEDSFCAGAAQGDHEVVHLIFDLVTGRKTHCPTRVHPACWTPWPAEPDRIS